MSTAVPGVERTPNPVAARACGTWNPDGVRAWPGKPTARKAQTLSGDWMTREANAGSRKATGNREIGSPPPAAAPHNWPDTGWMPGPKGG